MTIDVTAYICCTHGEGIEIEPPRDQGDETGISINETEIEAQIVPSELPDGCDTSLVGKITVFAHTSGGYFYTCRDNTDDYLYIQYPETGSYQYPELTAKNHEHCQWIETQITVDGPESCNQLQYGCLWEYTTVNSGGGEITGDKSEAFPNGGSSVVHQLLDNSIVPGMRVRLEHVFFNYYETRQITTTHDYYHTPAITGGQVVAVNHAYNDPRITYDVALVPTTGTTKGADREIVTCKPSDWVEWEVGDFVFVTKPVTGDNSHDNYTIIPMMHGGYGA